MIDYNDNEGHINPHRGVFSLIDMSFHYDVLIIFI
jgi:hypothetical protein